MTAPEPAAPMTPERWRAVDAILHAALACEPDRRDAVVDDACGGDEALRREVASLLAAHDGATDDFLERPAVDLLTEPAARPPDAARLEAALDGRYAIEREIARGGMATVYLARDLRHGRRVAIKVMRGEIASAVGAERFLREVRITASLQHPHILPLFDSGSAGDLLWYAMPFVEGETLRARLAREGRLPVGEAVRIAREVADALEHAHARGVVHRDVKPENVLLHGGHALVADFGIALAIERAGGERLTRTGLTLGTPQYMAPEQATGARVIDARADVYALGAVLHEMLAGEPPFAAASRQAVVQRMMHEPPRALATYRPDVPSAVDAAVRRALAKQPDARYASAAAFAAGLAPFAGGEPTQPTPVAPNAAESDARRGRVVRAGTALWAIAAALVVGLVAGWALSDLAVIERWLGAAKAVGAPASDAGAGSWPAAADAHTLVVVDRAGRPQHGIPADGPWTPRFSPDGRHVAYGAIGTGRGSRDVWVTDLRTGTTRRLTDDDGDSNDPQWSPDGAVVAYSVNAPGGKDLAVQRLAGGSAHALATRAGTQFASDWLRDGRALVVTDDAGGGSQDILVQPVDGSAAWPYAATAANETAARVSPDGRWIAYTSDESGRPEVYLDSYPRAGRRVMVSQGGGIHPVWRGDGRELYYWRDDALVAVSLGSASGAAQAGRPAVERRNVLFRAPYQVGLNTMYDVSADGERFVIVRRP